MSASPLSPTFLFPAAAASHDETPSRTRDLPDRRRVGRPKQCRLLLGTSSQLYFNATVDDSGVHQALLAVLCCASADPLLYTSFRSTHSQGFYPSIHHPPPPSTKHCYTTTLQNFIAPSSITPPFLPFPNSIAPSWLYPSLSILLVLVDYPLEACCRRLQSFSSPATFLLTVAQLRQFPGVRGLKSNPTKIFTSPVLTFTSNTTTHGPICPPFIHTASLSILVLVVECF